MRAQSPASFTRDESIEVATADESFATTLSLGNGGMALQNAEVAVAALDPAKAFGSSASGPLQFRVIGGRRRWRLAALATLVRLPVLQGTQMPRNRRNWPANSLARICILIDSVASSPQFDHPIQVPDGFPG